MPTHLNIDGVWVSFPHKPYDLQTAYMSSLIKALNEVRVRMCVCVCGRVCTVRGVHVRCSIQFKVFHDSIPYARARTCVRVQL